MRAVTPLAPEDTARLALLDSGCLIEAFSERGYFPYSTGLLYLPPLLTQPQTMIAAKDLMLLPARKRVNGEAEFDALRRQKSVSLCPAIDRQTLQEALERLEELELSADRDSVGLMGRGMSEVSPSESAEHDMDALTKLRLILNMSTGRGRTKDLNNYRSHESARTSTRANLHRLFRQFRKSGLRKTARHFEDNIQYRYSHWFYAATSPTWRVDRDL